MSMFDSSPATPLVLRADQPLLDEAAIKRVANRQPDREKRHRSDDSSRGQDLEKLVVRAIEDFRPELLAAWIEVRRPHEVMIVGSVSKNWTVAETGDCGVPLNGAGCINAGEIGGGNAAQACRQRDC